MSKVVRFLMGAFSLLFLTAGMSGCQQEGIIPARDMSTLFAEFYTIDAMVDVSMEHGMDKRLNVDSLRMYRPSLEAMGYTDEDFRTSLNYYLHRPEALEKILDQAWKKLDDEATHAMENEEEVSAENETVQVTGIDEVWEDGKPVREQEVALDSAASPTEKKAPRRQQRKKLTKQEMKQLEKELK